MCVSCRKELAETHKTNKPCGKCHFYLLISKTFVEAGKNDSKRKWSNQKREELMFANAEEEFFYEVRLSCASPSQGIRKTIFYLSSSCRQFWGNTYGCFKMPGYANLPVLTQSCMPRKPPQGGKTSAEWVVMATPGCLFPSCDTPTCARLRSRSVTVHCVPSARMSHSSFFILPFVSFGCRSYVNVGQTVFFIVH